MKFVFIAEHQAIWPVAWLYDALGVGVELPHLAEPLAQRQIPQR